MRDDLKAELEERDVAKQPLSLAELKELFKGRDPRDYLATKSPSFKAKGLTGKALTAGQALKLMSEEPNLIRRPLTIAGKQFVPGFDKEKLLQLLG